MRYGVPLLGDRVAPRCTYADSVMLFVLRHNKVRTENKVSFNNHNLFDLRELLSDYRVDTLICGGISRENKEFLQARRIEIIDNVACTLDEIINAIRMGNVHSGFGFSGSVEIDTDLNQQEIGNENAVADNLDILDQENTSIEDIEIDCLSCTDRKCLRGEVCSLAAGAVRYNSRNSQETEKIIEAALDITFEEERTLCRLSELIYFCLEMGYKRIGVAYCIDLQEATDILVHVLRRFFTVIPVCCKVGGKNANGTIDIGSDSPVNVSARKQISCNPLGQAEVLNKLNSDFNVMVGVCIGADSVFAKASDAPVTTLFVKDRSLANNPIGALYSDYYLDEAKKTFAAGQQ